MASNAIGRTGPTRTNFDASFPIAGSTPCALRNPVGQFPGQSWTGGDEEDFEQNCSPNPNPFPDPKKPGEHCNVVWTKNGPQKNTYWPSCPGRPAFSFCNYTCQVSESAVWSRSHPFFTHARTLSLCVNASLCCAPTSAATVPPGGVRARSLSGPDPSRVRHLVSITFICFLICTHSHLHSLVPTHTLFAAASALMADTTK